MGHAGRRLSAAVGSGTGLLDGTPLVSPATGDIEPGPDDSPVPSRIRWRTGRRAAVLLCLLSVALLGWFWWQAAGGTAVNGSAVNGTALNGTEDVSPLSSVNASAAGDVPAPEPDSGETRAVDESRGEAGADTPGKVVVHVAGAVVRAGIVELPQGSRLHEAIAAAGGGAPDADPDQLNLAAVLEDGQKVLVPRQGETLPSGSASAGDTGGGGGQTGADESSVTPGKINVNTAGVEELATLPRVGPVLAQRIVEWRGQHGNFQRVEELDAVDGVGPKLLAALLPLVRV